MTHFLESGSDNTCVGYRDYPESRQGDWVCVKCNNLNFSFRKRCNRCKVQTREQNQQHILQAYHFYEEYYRQMNGPQYSDTIPDNQLHQNQYLQVIDDTLAHELLFDQGYEEAGLQINLPSVSPIIKRYNKQKTTPKTQISQGSSSEDQAYDPKEFLQEYCWQNILIDDEVGSEYSSRDNGDFWDLEMEKLVQNIVI